MLVCSRRRFFRWFLIPTTKNDKKRQRVFELLLFLMTIWGGPFGCNLDLFELSRNLNMFFRDLFKTYETRSSRILNKILSLSLSFPNFGYLLS